MKTFYITFIIGMLSLTSITSLAQHPFYDVSKIQKIEIYFTQSNWDAQMDSAKSGYDSYIMAKWVKINNVQFDSVGVQYKGSISYDSNNRKNSLHIALDEFDKKKNYNELTDIKLNNCFGDPSMIREAMSYSILSDYMHAPQCNFAQIYINGEYYGLYTNVESISKKFCANHFNSSKKNVFVNADFSRKTPPSAGKCNLSYLGADSTSYKQTYELKSDYGWNDFIRLCDTVSNYKASIKSAMDMDRVIWMMAYNNITVNLDSYTGLFCHNYYLFKDNTRHYNPIIWDLNMGLGGFPQAGDDSGALSALTVDGLQKLPLSLHEMHKNWPLIGYIFSVPQYKRMYLAHAKTIMNEAFANNTYKMFATNFQTLIDTAVKRDTKKFYSYDQFKNGMTGDVTVFNITGFYTVPGISNLMDKRTVYLQSTAEFKAAEPVIESVKSDNNAPALNSPVTITAQVTTTNKNAVLLGYRYSIGEKFIRIPMFDDGAHNDGGVGDDVYGASFDMKASIVQYYIYAENDTIGKFAPERAEHEFFTLLSASTPLVGDLVINEFMANNKNGAENELNKKEDWIELYNNSSKTINLSGLYLTDNYSDKGKSPFPSGWTIAPKTFLIVWADEKATTSTYLHANFKLSASGEQLMLSNGADIIYDSISFKAQLEDVSMGRCPDGTGKITLLNQSSFNAPNCTVGINELKNTSLNAFIYPNPTTDHFSIEFTTDESAIKDIHIYNSLGELIQRLQTKNKSELIDVSNYSNGVYFIKVNNSQTIHFTVIK
jgi:hypothetical protein